MGFLPRFLVPIVIAGMFPAMAAAFQTPLRAVLSGTVIDDSTNAPLENVNVFLANTTLGTSTNKEGRFEIGNIPQGSYSVAASRLGYTISSKRIMIAAANQSMKIRLRSISIAQGEVLITAPDAGEWKDQLKKFHGLFFGNTPNARHCRILNPEVLDFEEEGVFFSAKTRAPLEIENDALGYHVRFYMTSFSHTMTLQAQRVIQYDGSPQFTELVASRPEQSAIWKKNRLDAFRGSVRHFLSCLVNETWEDEGYVVSLTDQPIHTRLSRARTIVTPENINLVLSNTNTRASRALHYSGFLEVEYTKEMDGSALSQISWLELSRDSVPVSLSGLIMGWFPVQWYGYWVEERFADAMPLDYEPEIGIHP